MSDTPSAPVKAVFPKLAPVIRAASGIATNDIAFYRSLDQGIAAASSQSSASLLRLINSIVSSVESGDAHELDDKATKESWSTVSNVLDTFLERSDLAVDEVRRARAGKDVSSGQQSLTYLDDANDISANDRAPKRMEKPQLKFSTPVDNSESRPFKPMLTSKPHALVSLEETLKLTEAEETNPSHYPQPYETEIMKHDYDDSILVKSDPIEFKNWDETEAIWVDTDDALEEMLESLKGATVIAVDLEHHDYRSYYGIVCLMQISTRDQDWLIDTLALRDKLQVLNVVFTDPLVTKVFHGAFMDIIWLQRDLGIYVVSLFDTYHASKQLGFPKHSLAYLLERFAHFKTSKKYQLADWRIRPLTKPMRAYARSDTHFLLYIFDQLRNSLIESQKLDKVLFESRNVAVRRFEFTKFRPTSIQVNTYSPIEKDDPWKRLIYQFNLSPSRSKLVEELYNWRDRIAREEDESPRYIMPNQLLVSLASNAPTDAAGVLATSNIITDHVRKNCKAIADLISRVQKDVEREDFQLYSDATGDLRDQQEETLSFEQVEKSELIFEQLELNLNHKELLSSKSNILGSKQLTMTGVFSPMKSKSVPSSLAERQAMINEKLAVVNVSLDLDLEEDLATDGNDEEKNVAITSTNTPSVVSQQPKAVGMFENSEDVIVLKKKVRQAKNEKKAKKSSGETLDYSSAPKIMAKPVVPKRFERKRPSDKFDPYSQESEGPRPAKKKTIMHPGKTISYSSKKKK